MPFAFITPWILGFLIVLPLVWWMLRLTPPAPKKIIFPALMLLRDLVVPQQVAATTPWWIILLRLAIITLTIVAFAEPVINPVLSGPSDTLLIAIDNDWASARAWPERQSALRVAIETAINQQRQIILVPTAPDAAGNPLQPIGPLAATAALHEIGRIIPEPWPADWQKAGQAMAALDKSHIGEALWLASGIGSADARAFAEQLQQFNIVHVRSDPDTPVYTLQAPQAAEAANAPTTRDQTQPTLAILRANTAADAAVDVVARAANGETLGHFPAQFKAGAPRAFATLDLPLDVRNRIARFDIDGQHTAASTFLLDGAWQKRPVGIAGDRAELEQHSLLSGLYYLDRALSPFADMHIDPLDALLTQNMAVIILPDTVVLNEAQGKALLDWVRRGGVLIHFGGDRLAAQNPLGPNMKDSAVNALLPVAVRTGDRTMGGSLSWDTPQKLQVFAATSPFAGLAIPADVTITRQILAEPSPDLAAHSWAALQDGTPLVTAKILGQGLTVLFHVPETTGWSNLPLSGLFVDMLRRTVELAHGTGTNAASANRPHDLPPLQALNGFGELQSPAAAAQSVAENDLTQSQVGPHHPPGLYGTADNSRALNLGAALGQPIALNGVAVESYRLEQSARNLKPFLLLAAFILLLADFLISLRLRGLLGRPAKTLALLALFILCHGADAHAAPRDADNDVELTGQTELGYIVTGNREIDQLSGQGLQGLARVLQNRTSINHVGVAAIDLAGDDLALLPLLYWPLASGETPLTPDAARKVNAYLHHGGMILFDTLNGTGLPPLLLQHLLAGLDMPVLARLPDDHVLKRSFYLLDLFPGRYDNADFWLQIDDSPAHDGVATVLEGNNGWAAAWATDATGRPLYPCIPGGEVQREQAYRFGVNLVMYALTGNYKSDQIHATALLKRLGVK